MIEIIGVQFKNTSRVYYFSPLTNKFEVGEYAIVETVRGLELGKVIIANRMVEDEDVLYELKPVIRKANQHDISVDKKNQELVPKSFEIFKECVNKLSLPMKPLYCEYTIDSSKIIFYYTADDRVDFRELLKILTPNFHARVELRQIGPREAARIVGGIGNCGRVICCSSCLNNFDFVTMKMAKDQGMSLNTSKISGVCGKLMCCIGYEHEMYLALKKEVPGVGELVKTPNCPCCKVVSVDYMKKNVNVLEKPDGMPVKYSASDVELIVKKDPSVEPVLSVVTSEEIKNDETVAVIEEPQKVKVEVNEESKTNRDNNKKSFKPYHKGKKPIKKVTNENK